MIDIKSPNFEFLENLDPALMHQAPFYGYVVCDLTKKVKKWLEIEKDFKPMPDRLGWFRWRENINLYIEVLTRPAF